MIESNQIHQTEQAKSQTKKENLPPEKKPVKKSRLKNFIFNLLLLVGSTLFALVLIFLLGELWIRSCELPADTGSIYITRMDKLPRTVLKPGVQEIAAGAPVHVNQLGFRGREYTQAKPPGTYRIIALGDSFTFGAGAPEDVLFTTRLEKMLSDNGAFGKVEVLNLGVVDYNTDDELARLQDLGLSLAPDCVVLFYVMNDIEIKPEYLPQAELQTAQEQKIITAKGDDRQYRDPLYNLVNSLRKSSHFLAFLAPRIASMGRLLGWDIPSTGTYYSESFQNDVEGWKRSKTVLRQLKVLGQERGFQFAIVLFPLLTNLTNSYPAKRSHEVIAAFAREEQIPFLDLLPFYLGKNAASLWVSLTDGHPNAEGHRIAAEAIAPFLLQNLKQN